MNRKIGLVERAIERLSPLESACTLCPRDCRVDRTKGAEGVCRTGRQASVSHALLHFGEEPVISGASGSGTIFFSGCNLKCVFCQNYEISHDLEGEEATPGRLTALMFRVRELGCHNLNLVTPTHVVPQVLEALESAVEDGFDLPIVYNTGGYDSLEVLRLLDGVVDIYMPDMKYGDAGPALSHSHVPDYPAVNRAAVREMHRQVGDLVLDRGGIAFRGLLVRHLVLPDGLAGSESVFRFLAGEVSRSTWVNVMAQYRPAYRARHLPPLDRAPTEEEVDEARALARLFGLALLEDRSFPRPVVP